MKRMITSAAHGDVVRTRRSTRCLLQRSHPKRTALERHLSQARLMLAIGAGSIVVCAVTLLHGDVTRASALVAAAAMWSLAALLPLLTGRLKLGAFEGKLRE